MANRCELPKGLRYYRSVGHAAFSVSATGVLAYQGAADAFPTSSGSIDAETPPTPDGRQQNYGTVRLSPDGRTRRRRCRRSTYRNIRHLDLRRLAGVPVRFTFDLDDESEPVWSPDGRRIMFRMNRGRPAGFAWDPRRRISSRRRSGDTEEELLVGNRRSTQPGGLVSRRSVDRVHQQHAADRSGPVDAAASPGIGKPRPFVATRFDEWGARFSPNSPGSPSSPRIRRARSVRGDGRRTGRQDAGLERRRHLAALAPRRQELFYVSADYRSIMAVPIDWTPTLQGWYSGAAVHHQLGAAASV